MEVDRSITDRREWPDDAPARNFGSEHLGSVQVPEGEIWYVEAIHGTDMDDDDNIQAVWIAVGAEEKSEYPDSMSLAQVPRGKRSDDEFETGLSAEVGTYAYPGDTIFYTINADNGDVDGLAEVEIRRVA